jgi:sec-independent protein translocase protein TatA
MSSIWHWLIVLLVIALLFGAGRISGVMGDIGKGIKSFKKGLNEDDEAPGASGTTGATGAAKPQGRISDERPVDQRTGTGTAHSSVDVDKI